MGRVKRKMAVGEEVVVLMSPLRMLLCLVARLKIANDQLYRARNSAGKLVEWVAHHSDGGVTSLQPPPTPCARLVTVYVTFFHLYFHLGVKREGGCSFAPFIVTGGRLSPRSSLEFVL